MRARRTRNEKDDPLDFPEERVKELVIELFRILLQYLSELWTATLVAIDHHGKEAQKQLLKWYQEAQDSLADRALILYNKIPDSWHEHKRSVSNRCSEIFEASDEWLERTLELTRFRLALLPPLLEDARHSFENLPLEMQGSIALAVVLVALGWVLLLRKLWRSYCRSLRKHNRRKRRKLRVKEGQAEILHGRTTLVYGAHGDLRDEEYLDDESITSSMRRRGFGRFGFDFFGINKFAASPKKRSPSKKKRRAGSQDKYNRNRGRSRSSGDHNFGSPAPRKRTSSTESFGNPAMIRPRSNSSGSLGDTVGGFLQGFGSLATRFATQGSSNSSNIAKTKKAQTPRFKKERLGSMDVFFAPGKNGQPTPSTPRTARSASYDSGSKIYPHTRRQVSTEEPLNDTVNTWEEGRQQPRRDGGFKSVQAERHYYNGDDKYGDQDSIDSNDEDETRYLYDEFGVVTLSHKVTYHGPFQPLLHCGSTLVPPLPLEVVARKIFSAENDLPLKRVLKLDLLKNTLTVVEPSTSVSQNGKWDVVYEDIDSISLKFKTPLEGGAFWIYRKGTPQHNAEHWKEHTSESAHAAAQFQLDFLAFQILGQSLKQIFEALNLVHQGSLAYSGQELVLHDNHRGSDGSEENENGDKKGNKKSTTKSVEATQCVAWDDAMRAMSSIPTVRIALERLWLSHRRPNEISSSFQIKDKSKRAKETKEKEQEQKNITRERKSPKNAKEKSKIALDSEKVSDADLSLLKEEYIKKRLLLGPVDFFRLFVPTLPETAVPEGDTNNRGRMEQLLRWRKRVARASVLVRSYARARRVANKGWDLEQNVSQNFISSALEVSGASLGDFGGEELTKRFAYDGNANNNLRDIAAKNEIYEASVSRDVMCHVRPFDYLLSDEEKNGRGVNEESEAGKQDGVGNDDSSSLGEEENSEKHLVMSPYQAYTYVTTHYFKASNDMLWKGGALHPSRDPVEMFPSLKHIIVNNPDLDFFVDCTSNATNNVVMISLFVRSLPKGIDPQFDNVIERFSNSSEKSRKEKLYLMFQLGNGADLTFFGWLFLKLVSLYFRLTDTGRDSPMNLSADDRYGFPGVRAGGLFRTYHFGGSLQKGTDKPKNYIGVTKCVATSYQERVFGKMLFDKLQQEMTTSTIDYTYVIEGTQNDELPERALSTLRFVHVDPVKVAQDPRVHLSIVEETEEDEPKSSRPILQRSKPFSPLLFRKAFESVLRFGESGFNVFSTNKKKKGSLQAISEEDERGFFDEIPEHLLRGNAELDYREKATDLVIDILRSVRVPFRHKPEHFDPTDSTRWHDETEETGLVVMSRIPVLRLFDRSDIQRYIFHSDYDLKLASRRLVETAAWRGKTFPIDKRSCRIELQNGQLFQQGYDRKNNPVFYFRNLCRGPWRGDIDAAIKSILYRFDKRLRELCKSNPSTRVTLVILMGHAKRGARKKKDAETLILESVNEADAEDDMIIDERNISAGTMVLDIPSEEEIKVHSGNPRISTEEKWMCHTNMEMIQRIFPQLIRHYPGRLSGVLVVKGRGKNHYYRDAMSGRAMAKRLLIEAGIDDWKQAMGKIRFVNKTADLITHISLKDLPTFVGGIAPIRDSAYEFE